MLLPSCYRRGFISDDELRRHHKEYVPRLLHKFVFRKGRPPRCHFAAVTDSPLWILRSGIIRFLFLPQNRHVSFRQETPLRNAFSPAATRTAQKLHSAEKLSSLLLSNSAPPHTQPSESAIKLKAFCKKEAAWPEDHHNNPSGCRQNLFRLSHQ